MKPTRRHGLGHIFLIPLLIAVFSFIGLVAALTGDGARDVISWVALAVPLTAIGWAMVARRS